MEIKRITLTGKHVRLEPIGEQHIAGLAEIGRGHDFWKFMLYGDMKTEADFRHFVEDLLARAQKGTDLPFAVIHLASGRVAGSTRYLNIDRPNRGLEVGGTWYGPEFQRTAVNTECKYLLLGKRTSARVFTCEFIEWCVQLTRLELLASFDLLSAFPPICIRVREHILRHRLGLALLRTLITLIFEF